MHFRDSGIEVSRYYARTSAKDLLVEMEYKSEEDLARRRR